MAVSLLAAEDALAQSVGPDAFNHVMSGNVDPSVFGYVDISATGTLVAGGVGDAGDEDTGLVTFPAGNTFFLYGTGRTSLTVSTNGFLSTNPATGSDFQRDCPAPVVGGADDGDRILVHHDDLRTRVYYQFFPVEAVSVIQWVGDYYVASGVGSGTVNFEILIYHALDIAYLQYQTVTENGLNATVGAQSAAGTTGFTYACSTASIPSNEILSFGSLAITEVRVDQPGNDDDEYFELAGAPGYQMTNLTYLVIGDGGAIEEVSSLAGTAFSPLGNTRYIGAEATFNIGTAVPDNLFALNFENDDTVTHVLVRGFTGTDGQDLDTNNDGLVDILPWAQVVDVVSLVDNASDDFPYATTAQVGPDPTSASGTPFHVQRCPDLTGAWVIADPDPANGGDSPATTLNLCAVCGDAATTYPEDCDDGGESAACDDDCTDASCGDGTVNGTAGEACDDGDLDNDDDCPDDGVNGGTCQPAACGDGFIDGEGAATEACDGDGAGTGGETVACDLNCTAATCGDMTVNNTAGETCDAGMRTAACDVDCTAVTCGDGHVNAAAGEMCDGDGAGMGGETATCDDDCTTSMCGDGVVNATANEDCDDSGESADCDDDCTDAVCGDNTENTAAGEQCDDGNTDNGDGCDATCQDEGTGGMGGGSAGMGGSAGGMGGTGNNGGAGGSGNSGNSSPDDDENDDETSESGGCDCSTPGTQGNPLAPWGVLLGLGLIARRRRTR